MSLKAKIEAVIYAAEEPVTLAQLASLFAAEVLESRAAFAKDPIALPGADGQGSFLAGDVVESAPTEALAAPTPEESAAAATSENPPATVEDAASDDAVSEGSASEPSSITNNQGPSDATEIDDKKATRQREREVREELKRLVGELIEEYSVNDRGMEIREVAGGYRVATKPEYHDAVRSFVRSLKPPMKLSLQALETLAVIAYKQPVTAPEVSEIRGVDSGGVLGSLMSRKLITTAGRKQVIGRPILYKTTKEFLLRFGLKDIGELPSMEEFEKMAGEIEIAESQITAEGPDAGEVLPFAEEAESGLEAGEAQPSSDEEWSAEAGSERAEAAEQEKVAATTESSIDSPQPGAESSEGNTTQPEALEVASAARGSHSAEGE
jgi:segregation and condensation protein B